MTVYPRIELHWYNKDGKHLGEMEHDGCRLDIHQLSEKRAIPEGAVFVQMRLRPDGYYLRPNPF